MPLELELLVLAWDNYKKNVSQPWGNTDRHEMDIENAINHLIDEAETIRLINEYETLTSH